MNSPVITGERTESVKQLSEKMATSKAGSIVIVEDESPVGIVTDGDIVSKVVSKDLTPSTVKAEDVMSKPLHIIESEKEITEAARSMRRFGIKRLGVSYKRKLVGIISISDILAITPELFDIVSEKTKIMTGEVLKEKAFLAGYCDHCNQWADNLLEIDGKFVCSECRTGKPEEEIAQEQPEEI